jgi:hypothetical protein
MVIGIYFLKPFSFSWGKIKSFKLLVRELLLFDEYRLFTFYGKGFYSRRIFPAMGQVSRCGE